MFKSLVFFLFTFGLSGCLDLKPSTDSGDFYTWVDERGNLRTVKKSDIKAESPVSATPKVSGPLKNETPKNKKQNNDFNTADYISSDVIEGKASATNLYSWNQDGRQEIIESKPEKEHGLAPKQISNNFIKPLISFYDYREGKESLLSDQLSKELTLETLYITNKTLNTDYVLIEIDIDVSQLEIKSFVRSNKTSLPAFVFLDKNFRAEKNIEIFTDYVEETWSTHGFFKGILSVPVNAVYILITPNPLTGVIETPEKNITISNFGSIQISQSKN